MINKIAILGAGNMGTGLARLLGDNGYPIMLWTIEKEVAKEINARHQNKKYLPGIKLALTVAATTNLKLATRDSEIVIFAVPTQVVAETIKRIKKDLLPGVIVLSVAKGISLKTGETASQMIKKILPRVQHDKVAVLMGPLFAKEIAMHTPSVGLLATKDKTAYATLKKVFTNDYFFVRWSDDVLGAELGGALKNIYAILMGVCDGLSYGWNTKSATITAVVRELTTAGHLLGGKKETLMGLAGLGDLLTTGFGETSRNRRFGEYVCSLQSVPAALAKIGQVVEGHKTVEVAVKLLAKYKARLPLLFAVHKIIHQKNNPCRLFHEILQKYI